MRDTTSARVNRIKLRLMVATCSSLSWPSDRLLRGYTVAISLSLAIAVLGFVAQALGLPDRILSPLMYAGVIGCGHPVLIAAGFAQAIVGRPDYVAGQTDIAWDAAFCCALLLYVLVLLAIAASQLRDGKQSAWSSCVWLRFTRRWATGSAACRYLDCGVGKALLCGGSVSGVRRLC